MFYEGNNGGYVEGKFKGREIPQTCYEKIWKD